MAMRLPKLRVNRLWVLIIISLLLAMFAIWLSITYLKRSEEELSTNLRRQIDGGPKASVIVPTADLPLGAIVGKGSFAARDISLDLAYKETLTTDQFEAIKGRKLLRPVQKGRPLMRADVFDDSPPDFSYVVKTGMRALTIDIDEVNSIAQMLRAGNHIDLHLIAADPTGGGQEVFLFLQNVKVLATGTRLRNEPLDPNMSDIQREVITRFGTVTIEVTPEEAAYVALAQQSGRIRATLRNVEDKNVVALDRITLGRLVGAKGLAFSSSSSAGGVVRKNEGGYSVEYFVGGRNTGGSATPISVNVPSINVGGAPSATISGGVTSNSNPAANASFSATAAAGSNR